MEGNSLQGGCAGAAFVGRFSAVVFQRRSFFEGGTNAGDFVAHDAHGEHAEARGELEHFGNFRAGDEAELGIFGEDRAEAVVTGEGGWETGNFARAEGAWGIESVDALEREGDCAFADDEDAGERVAAVKQGSAIGEGDARRDAIELDRQFGQFLFHTPSGVINE